MNNIRGRRIVVPTLAVLASLAWGGVVGAVPSDVLFVDEFDEKFSDDVYAEFLESACGVEDVAVEVHAAGRVRVYSWGAIGFERVTARATNARTGQYFVQAYRNHFEYAATETLGGDGLVYVDVETTYSGLAQQFRAPGVGVIVRDAGTIGFEVSLVVDPMRPPGEEVIEVVETFDARGPHPWAEQGQEPTPEQATAICGALGGTPTQP